MPTNGRMEPEPGEVKVRLYGQGLGDCFLLAFPRIGVGEREASYVLIDCGAAMSTPDREARAREVVADVRAATGGRLDVLIVTHQHFDHISGFADAWQEWKGIRVEALYLPWTESTAASGEHKTVGRLREALERASRRAVERAAEEDVLALVPELRVEASFLGVSLDGLPLAAAGMDETMELIRSLCPPENVRYFEPGEVFRVPGTASHGFVLGPPLPDVKNVKGKRLIELLVDEDDDVMYSYRQLGMAVDYVKPGGAHSFAMSDDPGLPALASALLADGDFGRDSDEDFCPFGPHERLDWDHAMRSDFFLRHYGGERQAGDDAKYAVEGDESGRRGENGAWRRIDSDWLGGAARMALRASGYTNNLSMVVAFDVPERQEMLLFPGDAQVGNWLSWHSIREWRWCDGEEPSNPPARAGERSLMQNLLRRVVFYKAGHHGSHNATIRKLGLEAMTHEDLVAYLPVSVPVAQDLMGYCPMPFYPVVHALHRRTKGRVFLSNGHAVRLGTAPQRSEEELLREAGIVRSDEKLPAIKGEGAVPLEEEYPLYLEITVPQRRQRSERRTGRKRVSSLAEESGPPR